jgi:hypothetical protein
MNELARNYLPWLLSAMTIYMTFLQGEKLKLAWVIGLINQGGWLFFAIGTQTWGLLPLNAALWYLYIRNYIKWDLPLTVVDSNPFINRLYVSGESGDGNYRLIIGYRKLVHMQNAMSYVVQLPTQRDNDA